jgi:hypothetical protein
VPRGPIDLENAVFARLEEMGEGVREEIRKARESGREDFREGFRIVREEVRSLREEIGAVRRENGSEGVEVSFPPPRFSYLFSDNVILIPNALIPY